MLKKKKKKGFCQPLLSTQLTYLCLLQKWQDRHTCCVGYWISNICSHHGVRIEPHPQGPVLSWEPWGAAWKQLENHKGVSILRIERNRERETFPQRPEKQNSEYLKYNWTIEVTSNITISNEFPSDKRKWTSNQAKKYFNMIIFRYLVMISKKMLYIKKTYEIKMSGNEG